MYNIIIILNVQTYTKKVIRLNHPYNVGRLLIKKNWK